MLIPHWPALMWLIDMDFYNNREEDCYAIQYNDGLQLIQWSNITISWMLIDSIAKLSPRIQCISVIVLQLIQWSNITISWMLIDSIAKLSPRIQCISVIVPFGFYRIDCMILSIDWVLSMYCSIELFIINDRKIPKKY